MSVAGRELLSGLNQEQRNAVECTEGPLLVLAGAGTGKTKVITSRIAYLLRRGIPAHQILAVTFTRKAAIEMKTRIEELVGNRPSGLTVSTFHALGFRILRELSRGALRVLEEADKLQLIERLIRHLGLYLHPERTLFQISRAKNSGLSPADVRSRARTAEENDFATCYTAYCEKLRALAAIDLDDMISLPLELLRNSSTVQARYRRRWQYILVDEYQDTNQVQYDLMRSILGAHSNICVVGDDDQSIYGFRGATVGRILSFADDFPNATTIALETNYRSHAEIISLANAVISAASKRYPKRLRSHLGAGGAVEWKRVGDEELEAAYIARQIRSLAASGAFTHRDIAIISRVTKNTEVVRRVLKTEGLPASFGNAEADHDAVRVMTLHQSKGLEFPVVFVTALEDDSLPH